MAIQQDQYLTTSLVARQLERSEQFVRDEARAGRLESIRTASGIRLFTREAVENFRRAREARAGR